MTPTSPRRLAYAAWIIVCVVWGTTYLGIRIALESIPPALIGGIRYTAAGVVLIAWLRLRGERVPSLDVWWRLAVVAILLIVIGNGFVIWAEQWVPSGVSAVVVATAPFWMSTFEAIAPAGERFHTWTIVGLCVGFAGIVLLVWPDLWHNGEGHQFVGGIVALQLACVGWAAGSVYSKRYVPAQRPIGASAVQMLIGGVAMLVIASVRGEWSQLILTPRTATAELYLIVFGSLIGYSSYLYALEHLPVSTVSLYAYANPIIAVILGAVVAGEPFGARVIAASTMVFTGIATVRWRSRRVLHDPPTADQSHEEQHDRDDQQHPDEVP